VLADWGQILILRHVIGIPESGFDRLLQMREGFGSSIQLGIRVGQSVVNERLFCLRESDLPFSRFVNSVCFLGVFCLFDTIGACLS